MLENSLTMFTAKNLVYKVSAIAALAVVSIAAGYAAPQQKAATIDMAMAAPAEPYSDATYPCPKYSGYGAERGWIARTKTFADTAKSLKRCRLVFVGDSITDNWRKPGKDVWEKKFTKFNSLNLGYSGDRTENVLYRLIYGKNLPANINPRAFILLIGTNNFGHRMDDPKDVAAGEIKIVEFLRSARPDAHVIVMATFPRGGEKFAGKIEAQNEAVSAWIKARNDKKISFLDINPKFTGTDGKVNLELLPDGLHPNAQGHEIWADEILKELSSVGIK